MDEEKVRELDLEDFAVRCSNRDHCLTVGRSNVDVIGRKGGNLVMASILDHEPACCPHVSRNCNMSRSIPLLRQIPSQK